VVVGLPVYYLDIVRTMDLSNLLNNSNPSPPPWRGQRLIFDQPIASSAPIAPAEPAPALSAVMGPPSLSVRGRGRGARSSRGRGGRLRGGRAAPALASAPAARIGTRLTQDENIILVEAAASLGELWLDPRTTKEMFWDRVRAKFERAASRSYSANRCRIQLRSLVADRREALEQEGEHTGRNDAESDLDHAVDEWIEVLASAEADQEARAELSSQTMQETEEQATLRNNLMRSQGRMARQQAQNDTQQPTEQVDDDTEEANTPAQRRRSRNKRSSDVVSLLERESERSERNSERFFEILERSMASSSSVSHSSPILHSALDSTQGRRIDDLYAKVHGLDSKIDRFDTKLDQLINLVSRKKRRIRPPTDDEYEDVDATVEESEQIDLSY
jgi:hypothetical protein